jgi:hypothetical protein
MIFSLSKLLKINSGYSIGAGILGLVLVQELAEALVLPVGIVGTLCAGLVGFGTFLIWLNRPSRISAQWGRVISIADFSWVFGVVGFVVLANPAATGVTIALLSSVPVLVLAALQLVASKKLA